jgi:hypothetical protein
MHGRVWNWIAPRWPDGSEPAANCSRLWFHKHLFGHPGTYDVDVLLHSKSLEDGVFDGAADRMLEDGYLRAVKNRFQAHRILQVAGEKLVFHVDFLNEKNQGEQLNVVGGKGKLQSIYTPAMEAVFKYDGFRQHEKLPGVRFPSVETFIASKAVAAGVKKRRRDAFDIYISVIDQDSAAAGRLVSGCERCFMGSCSRGGCRSKDRVNP